MMVPSRTGCLFHPREKTVDTFTAGEIAGLVRTVERCWPAISESPRALDSRCRRCPDEAASVVARTSSTSAGSSLCLLLAMFVVCALASPPGCGRHTQSETTSIIATRKTVVKIATSEFRWKPNRHCGLISPSYFRRTTTMAIRIPMATVRPPTSRIHSPIREVGRGFAAPLLTARSSESCVLELSLSTQPFLHQALALRDVRVGRASRFFGRHAGRCIDSQASRSLFNGLAEMGLSSPPKVAPWTGLRLGEIRRSKDMLFIETENQSALHVQPSFSEPVILAHKADSEARMS